MSAAETGAYRRANQQLLASLGLSAPFSFTRVSAKNESSKDGRKRRTKGADNDIGDRLDDKTHSPRDSVTKRRRSGRLSAVDDSSSSYRYKRARSQDDTGESDDSPPVSPKSIVD